MRAILPGEAPTCDAGFRVDSSAERRSHVIVQSDAEPDRECAAGGLQGHARGPGRRQLQGHPPHSSAPRSESVGAGSWESSRNRLSVVSNGRQRARSSRSVRLRSSRLRPSRPVRSNRPRFDSRRLHHYFNHLGTLERLLQTTRRRLALASWDRPVALLLYIIRGPTTTTGEADWVRLHALVVAIDALVGAGISEHARPFVGELRTRIEEMHGPVTTIVDLSSLRA